MCLLWCYNTLRRDGCKGIFPNCACASVVAVVVLGPLGLRGHRATAGPWAEGIVAVGGGGAGGGEEELVVRRDARTLIVVPPRLLRGRLNSLYFPLLSDI